jgi:5-formyltetrahydrofolate cyclo-ligase
MHKKELRKIFIDQRKSLSSEEREAMSIQISERIITKFELEGYNISIFLPISRMLEINTWNIIENLKANYILPVVKEDGKLEHILYESEDQLEISDWGIPEPTRGEVISPKEIDVVLVPLLICDESGNRVGYGKGFYDQFLSSCPNDCIFIGLSYFEPIEVIADVRSEDVPLHFCVTPKKVHTF